MAKKAAGRQIQSQATKPKHLATRNGAGRSRQPTDFDNLVPEWYEDGEWHKIVAQGETVEEQLADLDDVFKAVNRAVSYHELGADRLKEDNPEDPDFSGYGVWVHVRGKQARGPKVGSIKDPESGKRVPPDDDPNSRYAELKAMRDAGEL